MKYNNHYYYSYNNKIHEYKTYVNDCSWLTKVSCILKYNYSYKTVCLNQKSINGLQPIPYKRLTDNANEKDMSKMDILSSYKSGPVEGEQLTYSRGCSVD